jgi:uncharacterized membrane protein
MRLYHGSNCLFESINLSKSKDKRDFGKGFYTTTIKEQAVDWAVSVFDRYGGEGKFVYELNDQVSFHTEKALSFLTLIGRTEHAN